MKRILLFLFVLLSLSEAKASDTLTIRQVFNFSVGDTFDYSEYTFNQCVQYSASAVVKKIVIQKSYNTSQDTLYYQYNVINGQGLNIQFFNASAYDTITNLDSFAYLTDPLLSAGNSAGCYSANYDTDNFWGYKSDSVNIPCFESNDIFRYTERLGITHYSLAGGGDPCGMNGEGYDLIYFANDSIHLGYDGVSDLSKTSNIKIHPNPTTDQLHLSFSDAGAYNARFIITDILGQAVYSSPVTQSETTHDISKLSAGIYTWRVVENNSILKTGKVVKE